MRVINVGTVWTIPTNVTIIIVKLEQKDICNHGPQATSTNRVILPVD